MIYCLKTYIKLRTELTLLMSQLTNKPQTNFVTKRPSFKFRDTFIRSNLRANFSKGEIYFEGQISFKILRKTNFLSSRSQRYLCFSSTSVVYSKLYGIHIVSVEIISAIKTKLLSRLTLNSFIKYITNRRRQKGLLFTI